MEASLPKNPDNEPIGPMDEKTFKGFLKKLDLAKRDVEEKSDEVKTARSALSSLWKEFKKAGGKTDTMRDVMKLRLMEEGDLVQYEDDRLRYAKWMKLPVGVQTDMFAGDEADRGPIQTSAPPAAPLTERSRRGPKGPKVVDAPNLTGSPLN